MRFIHTADWHLGRIFYEQYMTADQEYVLGQFLELVDEWRPDAVIIAGDIYDRAIPPAEAVRLLDEVLGQLAARRVPVIAISGNHDSTERIDFGSRLMRAGGVYMYGVARPDTAPVVLHDEAGAVYICPLAFADPMTVRIGFDAPEVCDYATLLAEQVRRFTAQIPAGVRSVAVAHGFVAGGSESESERPLSVGGTSQVPWTTFAGFDYTALGHLHRPQSVGAPTVRYSGSLLKYSFSEVADEKGIECVTLAADGTVSRETVHLRPRYDMRIVEGTFTELMSDAVPASGDYLLVRLHQPQGVVDGIGRLRKKFPRVLGIEPLETAQLTTSPRPQDIRRADKTELFARFVEDVGGAPMTEAEKAVMARIWQEVLTEDER